MAPAAFYLSNTVQSGWDPKAVVNSLALGQAAFERVAVLVEQLRPGRADGDAWTTDLEALDDLRGDATPRLGRAGQQGGRDHREGHGGERKGAPAGAMRKGGEGVMHLGDLGVWEWIHPVHASAGQNPQPCLGHGDRASFGRESTPPRKHAAGSRVVGE